VYCYSKREKNELRARLIVVGSITRKIVIELGYNRLKVEILCEHLCELHSKI